MREARAGVRAALQGLRGHSPLVLALTKAEAAREANVDIGVINNWLRRGLLVPCSGYPRIIPRSELERLTRRH